MALRTDRRRITVRNLHTDFGQLHTSQDGLRENDAREGLAAKRRHSEPHLLELTNADCSIKRSARLLPDILSLRASPAKKRCMRIIARDQNPRREEASGTSSRFISSFTADCVTACVARWVRAYSAFSSSTGSTAAARRAGRYDARPTMVTINATTPA